MSDNNDEIADRVDREMAMIRECRRHRLLEIKRRQNFDTDKELCDYVGIEPGFYSQLKKDKSIGEVLARTIELRLRKPRYWLDGVDDVRMLTRDESLLVDIYRGLAADRQTLLLGTAEQFSSSHQSPRKEAKNRNHETWVHEDTAEYVKNNSTGDN